MMVYTLITLWILSALPILFEKRILRMAVHLGIYSLITSIIFLIFGAPDVALAEASVSIFLTILIITCFEKYYNLKDFNAKIEWIKWGQYILLAIFTLILFFLFIHFVPISETNTYSKVQYLTHFMYDVGGENAVTAIYLGYRLYDTVFEALMLLIAAVAVSHLSWHKGALATQEIRPIRISNQAINIINLISPLLLVFGVYLTAYGHLSPGGGFQGGVVIATFFVCRYMVRNTYQMSVKQLLRIEKFIFAGIMLLAVSIVFLGLYAYFPPIIAPLLQNIYLVSMNIFIGAKVALGFVLLSYRFIAIERA